MKYNGGMDKLLKPMGIIPYLVLGALLLLLGLLSLNHIVDNFWPFDVARLDLVRATALGQADPLTLLQAANPEIVLAFLASAGLVGAGTAMPAVYLLNRRFARGPLPHFLIMIRQSMWVGLWLGVCSWLQMNRALSVPVALLAATVFVIFEFILQLRSYAALERPGASP